MDDLEIRVEHIEHALFGNGQPGLDRVARDFFAEWRGREAERDQREKKQADQMKRADRRWNLRVAILALVVGFGDFLIHGCAGHEVSISVPSVQVGASQPVQQDSANPPNP